MTLLRLGILFSLVGLAGCLSTRASDVAGGCYHPTEMIPLQWARNAVADRAGENRHKLPWTDTLPPTVIRDDELCVRAALATVEGKLPAGVDARASVVRAGGLYFVYGPGPNSAGEFTVVHVLDGQLRRITGIAG